MSKEAELGQLAFGNPTGNYGTEEYVDALIEALLTEIERVFWNNNQKNWDRGENPKIRGLKFQPYYWGDKKAAAKKSNLKFNFSPQEIRWYKHPGRGQSCTIKWDEKQWKGWFDKGMKTIRKGEKEIF